MSCEKYRELFDDVLDDEIKKSRKNKFFAHLDECPSCGFEFKLYKKVVAGVEGLEELEAPPDLTAIVMKGIQAQPAPWQTADPPAARVVPGSWVWAGAFAVMFLVTLASLVTWDARPARTALGAPAPLVAPQDETPVLGKDSVREEALVKNQVAEPNQEVGIMLVRHQGDVEVLDLATSSWESSSWGSPKWKPVGEQSYLNFGDRVRTGSDGIASLEYQKEKVSLRIKPQSIFQVVDRQTLRVFAGNAWVNVRRKGTIFRTETPNAIASVRGTKYSVEVKPMTDLFSSQGVKSCSEFINRPNTPAPTADLALFSTQMGLAMMKSVTGIDVVARTESEIKVYESVVNVVARDARGCEKGSIDVEAGFASSVQLASVAAPRMLTESDFFAWASVMPYDADVLARARAKASSPAGSTAGGARITPPAPVVPVEPVSESERPGGFEDVHRR